MPDEHDFLRRWSRRKAAASRAEEVAAQPAAAEEPAATTEPVVVDPDPPAAAAEPPELPDPETLDVESDFKAFMAENVPANLRRAALRRLWRVNPIIGALDSLDDHYVTADFTDAARVVPNLRTVYRVGKEMLAALERMDDALQAEAHLPAATAAPAQIAVDATSDEMVDSGIAAAKPTATT
jgi:hypothetical protein